MLSKDIARMGLTQREYELSTIVEAVSEAQSQGGIRAESVKVAIIGSDPTTYHLANWLSGAELAQVVWVDRRSLLRPNEQSSVSSLVNIMRRSFSFPTFANSLESSRNSAILVIADLPRASEPTTQEEKGNDPQKTYHWIQRFVSYSPNAVIIVAAEPVGANTELVTSISGFPRERVIGIGKVVESAYLGASVSDAYKISVDNVEAYTLENSMDAQVSWARFTQHRGIPITHAVSNRELKRFVQAWDESNDSRTSVDVRGANLLVVVNAVVQNTHQTLPCFVQLAGEYGVHGVFVSVPVTVGRRGVEDIVELQLGSAEFDTLFENRHDELSR
jgi:malate dehydrogenase